MPVSGEQRPEYFEFASRQLGETWSHGPCCKCLTSLSGTGKIQAVVIFDLMTDVDCRLNIATDGKRRWLSKAFLAWIFRVAFVQWSMRRVSALVEAHNAQSVKMVERLGFVQEGVLRKAFGEQDGILFGMLREECRYLDIEVD
ncbi:GNAT family N-acetyltransferase [Allopusillimonas ginsengisoli]|uniref:GNAT family N-acetyltransferase n=1 Tax=Allopusillimonas ginsengisoli TaxID=453575 RepID=UPI0039C31335